jgi:hypothetical protein
MFYPQPHIWTEGNFDYTRVDDNGSMGTQTMKRFLVESAPLTRDLLYAKFDRTMHHSNQSYGRYDQWSTPVLRYESPDRSSTSGTSSYATHSEMRSPYHADHYGSPEEFTQVTAPYSTEDQTYQLEPTLAGGLRELEYEHEPEPNLVTEESEALNAEIDVELKSESTHMSIDLPVEDNKNYSESSTKNSLRDGESVQPISHEEESSSDAEYIPGRSSRRRRSSVPNGTSTRNGQRRRSHHIRKNSSSTQMSGRVSKRTGRATSAAKNGQAYTDLRLNEDMQRYFPCPLSMYGCQSNFSSKNEWKRHVSTQHIKLGFWRCDLCTTTVDPQDHQTFYHNDFNRKDLFTQHLRRMHAAASSSQSSRSHKEYLVTEDNLAEHQKRCFQILRETPPQSQCLFCPETFNGPASWDQCMEHIGRHLEKDRKAGLHQPENWNLDNKLEQWMHNEGIIALDKNNQWKIGDGRPRQKHAACPSVQTPTPS